jgi:hypothetical protein
LIGLKPFDTGTISRKNAIEEANNLEVGAVQKINNPGEFRLHIV